MKIGELTCKDLVADKFLSVLLGLSLSLKGPTSDGKKGSLRKGVFLLKRSSLEALASANSLETPENGRILLVLPHSGLYNLQNL